jgi:pyruvate dehydrogenase E2 component (dihydrolipoamide acetyltransferase)
VQSKTLQELMRSLTDLVKRARAGSLRASEMSDPTITVTNLGDGGVQAVFGVIYPPQVALVGFGGVRDQSVVASLAADHRVSDGHRGSLFLSEVARLLQEPEKL